MKRPINGSETNISKDFSQRVHRRSQKYATVAERQSLEAKQ